MRDKIIYLLKNLLFIVLYAISLPPLIFGLSVFALTEHLIERFDD